MSEKCFNFYSSGLKKLICELKIFWFQCKASQHVHLDEGLYTYMEHA